MKIASVKHKGLRRFIKDDDASGLPTAFVDKIRKIVTFLQDMEDEEVFEAVPSGGCTGSPEPAGGHGA